MSVKVNFFIPSNLIPMATANAMLIIGSSKTSCDCDFGLHAYLTINGGIGLSLLVMDVLAKYVIKWILADNKISWIEDKILVGLQIFGRLLALIQLGGVIGLSVITFINYPYVTFDKTLKSSCQNQDRSIDARMFWPSDDRANFLEKEVPYCDYSIFMFSFCFSIIMWTALLIGAVSLAYILMGRMMMAKQRL